MTTFVSFLDVYLVIFMCILSFWLGCLVERIIIKRKMERNK